MGRLVIEPERVDRGHKLIAVLDRDTLRLLQHRGRERSRQRMLQQLADGARVASLEGATE
jgi:hypothetical protein